MNKFTYIQKDVQNIFIELENKLNKEISKIGTSWSDYESGAFVLLTNDQLAFRKENVGSSAKEVFTMQLEPSMLPRTLEQSKREKLMEIEIYDNSESVNSFMLAGVSMWIPSEQRNSLRGTIQSLRLIGELKIRIPVAGGFHEFELYVLENMLAYLEKYAWEAANVTQSHKNEIERMTEIEDIEAFDISKGYPEKLTFQM